MLTPLEIPRVFDRHGDLGGVLDVASFETMDFGETIHKAAIRAVLENDVNAGHLAGLRSRIIDRATFLGAFYDEASGQILRLGSYNGLTDPSIVALDSTGPLSGGGPVAEPGTSSEFAYAFAFPPYNMHASGRAVQDLFDTALNVLLPKHVTAEIHDWTSPDLVHLSPYFSPGSEWWGMFLWTIAVPDLHRLTVIAASSSD